MLLVLLSNHKVTAQLENVYLREVYLLHQGGNEVGIHGVGWRDSGAWPAAVPLVVHEGKEFHCYDPQLVTVQGSDVAWLMFIITSLCYAAVKTLCIIAIAFLT